jgi:hypothetical protein
MTEFRPPGEHPEAELCILTLKRETMPKSDDKLKSQPVYEWLLDKEAA